VLLLITGKTFSLHTRTSWAEPLLSRQQANPRRHHIAAPAYQGQK
jgi:hypothetical protein